MTRNQIHTPSPERWSLNHWTTRAVSYLPCQLGCFPKHTPPPVCRAQKVTCQHFSFVSPQLEHKLWAQSSSTWCTAACSAWSRVSGTRGDAPDRVEWVSEWLSWLGRHQGWWCEGGRTLGIWGDRVQRSGAGWGLCLFPSPGVWACLRSALTDREEMSGLPRPGLTKSGSSPSFSCVLLLHLLCLRSPVIRGHQVWRQHRRGGPKATRRRSKDSSPWGEQRPPETGPQVSVPAASAGASLVSEEAGLGGPASVDTVWRHVLSPCALVPDPQNPER